MLWCSIVYISNVNVYYIFQPATINKVINKIQKIDECLVVLYLVKIV